MRPQIRSLAVAGAGAVAAATFLVLLLRPLGPVDVETLTCLGQLGHGECDPRLGPPLH